VRMIVVAHNFIFFKFMNCIEYNNIFFQQPRIAMKYNYLEYWFGVGFW
jgi:hypothetical protein